MRSGGFPRLAAAIADGIDADGIDKVGHDANREEDDERAGDDGSQ